MTVRELIQKLLKVAPNLETDVRFQDHDRDQIPYLNHVHEVSEQEEDNVTIVVLSD